MPHHKSARLGRKIKAVRFILPLLALLAVIGLAVGQAYAPTPAEATHGGRGPSGPPGQVVNPVVTVERELYRNRHVPSGTVIHQFWYRVDGVRYTPPQTSYAQWFDLDWSANANGPWHSLIRGGGLSSFVSAGLPVHLTSVHVRVRGNNQHSPGPWSAPFEVGFTPYIDSVSAEANLTTATLRWSAVGGDEIHEFQVSKDNGRTWEDWDITVDFVPDPIRILSHTFHGLTPFTDYTLRVRPCRADGTCTHAPRAFVTTNGPDAAPGPLTDLSMGINTCYKEFRWRITPPEITETAGKAKHYQFQWRLDSDSDDETAWRNLRRPPASDPKFRNTWGFWTVPAAFGERGKFHMRVRAVNDHGDGPWINTSDANRDKVCSAQADLAPVTGESYFDPPESQPGQPAMNQTASVTVTAADPVALNEGGSGATYTVVLDGQPTANVTIAMSSDNGDVTTQPSSLTFTTGNWHTPRTVTVHAGHDDDAADDTATVSHTVSGAQGYAGITVASVSVHRNRRRRGRGNGEREQSRRAGGRLRHLHVGAGHAAHRQRVHHRERRRGPHGTAGQPNLHVRQLAKRADRNHQRGSRRRYGGRDGSNKPRCLGRPWFRVRQRPG